MACFLDAHREGDAAADVGSGRGDAGAQGDLYITATGSGGQDQETQKGDLVYSVMYFCILAKMYYDVTTAFVFMYVTACCFHVLCTNDS